MDEVLVNDDLIGGKNNRREHQLENAQSIESDDFQEYREGWGGLPVATPSVPNSLGLYRSTARNSALYSWRA